GILDSSGARVIGYGRTRRDGPLVDGNTVFEIGSVTKLFTSLVLADMALHREVALDDPVAKYLPPEVRLPTRNGRQITLADLASQVSGLPRMPSNLTPADPTNPYADYTVAQLYAFLGGYRLTRDPGAEYEYSNLGVALLGHVLALRAGKPYELLVAERVLRPLHMEDTRIALTPTMRARLATGHMGGVPVANWDLATFAGAGAMRSTANDMLRFLAASIDTTGPLAAAFRLTQQPRHRAGGPEQEIGLGWHIRTRGGRQIVWHNGATGGYHSFVGFDPATRRGVVLLANSSDPVDDIPVHLLDPTMPPLRPTRPVAVDSAVLARYVGRYELAPTFAIDVTREGAALFIQATNQARLQALASSEREFFLRVVNARITFEANSSGAVTGLVLHQNGRDTPGRRVR
ncbi:MAG: serine hydrolase, partial [Planctomycetes bacterium]|nr:serine hydrolase [Planctomycetota bacterium]